MDVFSRNFSSTQVALILKACIFATKAHAEVNQLREYSGDPYVTHPMEVAELLSKNEADLNTIIAGVLHDVIEDTSRNQEDISKVFGKDVAELCAEVSNPSKDGLSKDEWDQAVLDHLSKASVRAQNLKCIDIAVNVGAGDIALCVLDAKRARSYVPKKQKALKAMKLAEPHFRQLAQSRIDASLKYLANLDAQSS